MGLLLILFENNIPSNGDFKLIKHERHYLVHRSKRSPASRVG